MTTNTAGSNHGTIFSMLVVLVLASVGVSLLHLPILANNLAIFGIATVMALVVSFQYMNLRLEGPLVVSLVVLPLLLFGFLTLVLLCDNEHPIFSFLVRGLKQGWK